VAVLLIHSALGGKTTPGGPPPATTVTSAPAATTTVASKPAAKPRRKYYAIQSGDTFGGVAARLGTTVAALQQLNPGVSSSALHVGQKIRVA
jgi:LysM repeat protein